MKLSVAVIVGYFCSSLADELDCSVDTSASCAAKGNQFIQMGKGKTPTSIAGPAGRMMVVKGHNETDGSRKWHCLRPTETALGQRINVVNRPVATVCCNAKSEGFRPSCDWHDVTHAQATFHCESVGLRLCTGAELRGGAGQTVRSGLDKTGPWCKYDGYYIWTSTTCLPDPCTTSNLVVRGSPNAGGLTRNTACARMDDTRIDPSIRSRIKEFATVCCNSSGYGFRPSCDWHDVSLAESTMKCKSVGLRLCTLDEISAGAGQSQRSGLLQNGHFCGYDGYYSWSSTACVPDECTASHLVIKGHPNKDGTRRYECARAGTSKMDAKFRVRNREFATVCCNDSGEGFRPSCDWHDVTQPQAVQNCASVGLRLCTEKELRNGAGQTVRSGLNKTGSWCKYDGYFIWSSTTCE